MTTLTSAQLDAIEAAWSSWQAAEYPSDETEPRQVVLDAIPALIAAARLALAAQSGPHRTERVDDLLHHMWVMDKDPIWLSKQAFQILNGLEYDEP